MAIERMKMWQAMGITLVNNKLLAFATGAGFAWPSGAIFASSSIHLSAQLRSPCVVQRPGGDHHRRHGQHPGRGRARSC
jgi:hypothetical protein